MTTAFHQDLPVAMRRLAIQPQTLSPRQAAQFLGIGRTKIYELLADKRIEAYSLDGRIRVSIASCQAFLAALPPYEKGMPPAPPVKPKPKHGRCKVRR